MYNVYRQKRKNCSIQFSHLGNVGKDINWKAGSQAYEPIDESGFNRPIPLPPRPFKFCWHFALSGEKRGGIGQAREWQDIKLAELHKPNFKRYSH